MRKLRPGRHSSELFSPDPQLPGAYQLRRGLGYRVTFKKSVFDEHPNQVELLTYGSQLLDELLAMIPDPEPRPDAPVARLVSAGEPAYVRWLVRGEDGQPVPVRNLEDLERGLGLEPNDTVLEWVQSAQISLELEAQELRVRQAAVIQQRKRAVYLAERARAQRILVRAALVELALGQQPDLLEGEEDYPNVFGVGAVRGLRRHGYPWKPLFQLAWEDHLVPQATDPEWPEYREMSREKLKSTFKSLAEQAREAVQRLALFREMSEN